ncbi:MAG: hypothetical protein AAF399_29665 [Bacteroidota bacterium]
MNPGEKGWLQAFIRYQKRKLRLPTAAPPLKLIRKVTNSEEYLYQLIQPTGLMYGYPIRFISDPHPRLHEWGEKDKIKVLLAEGRDFIFWQIPKNDPSPSGQPHPK